MRNKTKGTYRFFRGKGGMVADDIIDRDTNGKGHTSIDLLSLDLFGVKFGSGSFNHFMAEFAKINNVGSRDTLANQSFQGQVDNLGGFLVLGADIAIINRWFPKSPKERMKQTVDE